MGFYNYQTSRVSSVIDFSAVDLESNRFNCGLNIELSEEFFLYTVRRGRIRERYRARRMFSNRVEHNIREFFAQ